MKIEYTFTKIYNTSEIPTMENKNYQKATETIVSSLADAFAKWMTSPDESDQPVPYNLPQNNRVQKSDEEILLESRMKIDRAKEIAARRESKIIEARLIEIKKREQLAIIRQEMKEKLLQERVREQLLQQQIQKEKDELILAEIATRRANDNNLLYCVKCGNKKVNPITKDCECGHPQPY
jgi:hypothetical protein